jgi:hypothetical protein
MTIEGPTPPLPKARKCKYLSSLLRLIVNNTVWFLKVPGLHDLHFSSESLSLRFGFDVPETYIL